MESSKIDECYDSDVATFLCGLNLSKYIELFSKQAVDLEIFLSLTDEDLCFMGITDPNDHKTLIDGINHFKSHKKNSKKSFDNDISLSDKDALVIATNSMKQLSMLHAALAHTRLRLKAASVRNSMIEKYTVASLMSILADEALSQNLICHARLLGLENMEDTDLHPTRYAVKRRISWILFITSATLTVASVLGLRLIKYS